ncbi:hypothetical protein [uncultured Thiodictyon sp.]|jgi:pyruvate formate lyase activating enzyme|uniref:hypothetical protein n=1 Tax=uncultured Thiodictyon sp. TaxID=1846217 RepID=UPI00260125A3|nr:hypothetical protein [uncultured Thiodictyon sp.]
MNWQPAEFFRAAGETLVCTLCPRACALADGDLGWCRVRRRRGGRLETATFATSLWHWDAVERKPLYHYRPGSEVLTLAAPGCTLRCLYCQNHRLSQFGREAGVVWGARALEPGAAIATAAGRGAAVNLDLKSLDRHRHRALTGGDPVPVLETLAILLAAGVWVEVSTPLIPGVNTDPAALRTLARTIAGLGRWTPSREVEP